MMFAAVSPLLALPGAARPACDVDILNEEFGYNAHTRDGYPGLRGIPSIRKQSWFSNFMRALLIISIVFGTTVLAQDQVPLEEHLIGVWRMDPRTLESPGITAVQEEGAVTVLERSADGSFRVMARITTRATAISDDLFFRPGCIGKTECVYDDATEGIGTLMRDKFFIDWLDDDGWIDDLFTVDGNEMTGDDGNGPIRLVKEE